MDKLDTKNTGSGFSKDLTLIIKGLLIVWLLFHHTMGSSHFVDDGTLFVKICRIIASQGAAVVAGFAFLSGYGLNETYNAWVRRRLSENEPGPSFPEKIAFSYSRAFRLLVNLWIVFIIFVGAILLFRDPAFLDKSYSGPVALGLLKNLSGGLLPVHVGTVNKSWWFVRAILSFYLIFPFVKCLDKKWALTITVLSFAVTVPVLGHPQNTHIFWYFQFFLGYYCSESGFFKAVAKAPRFDLLAGSALLFASVSAAMIKLTFYPLFPLWAISIVVFMYAAYAVIPQTGVIWKPFRVLGKYSSDMYLIHVFIHGTLLPEVVFFSMNPLWIIVSDVLICLGLSFLLSLLKKKTGLSAWLGRLCPDKKQLS